MSALARLSYRLGLGLLLAFVGFAVLFAGGETMGDPGGWKGLALVGAWLVPMLGLAALAWFRPDRSGRLLALLVAGVLAVDVWAALARHSWRSFEDGLGPLRAILSLTLAGALAAFAVKRPPAAARLLLVLGLVPVVLAQGRPGAVSAPLAAVSTPVAVAGGLLLVSVLVERRRAARPSTVEERTRHHSRHR